MHFVSDFLKSIYECKFNTKSLILFQITHKQFLCYLKLIVNNDNYMLICDFFGNLLNLEKNFIQGAKHL